MKKGPPSALCNCNIYCKFPLPAYFLGFFQTINTFPGLNLHSSSTTQYFNSIQFHHSLSLSSLFHSSLSPSIPYTVHLSPTIKLSFKSPPSFSLYKMALKVHSRITDHFVGWCRSLLCFELCQSLFDHSRLPFFSSILAHSHPELALPRTLSTLR